MRWWNRWRHRGFPGVNLVGYARGGLGLGETLRQFAQALSRQDLPFAMVDIDLHLGDRGRDPRLSHWIGPDNPYPVNFICVTASELPAVREHLGAAFFADRLNLGYWFWELEGFPPAWHDAFDLVDEAWTATPFVAKSLEPHAQARGRGPVRLVPHPVSVPSHCVGMPGERRRAIRRALGLPDDGLMFLSTFDYHSYLSRKNPRAVVDAFRQAFAGQTGPRLVLKSTNGHAAPALRDELMALTQGDARIHHLDAFLSHEDHTALMGACDVYVSLHRSEGFGQGMAEAMLMGKPVIATAWSGNLSFMNEHNSALVSASRVALGPLDYPYGEGQSWADPDLTQAAQWMRRAAGDEAWRTHIGRAARESVSRSNSPEACALTLRDAVSQAWQRRRQRQTQAVR